MSNTLDSLIDEVMKSVEEKAREHVSRYFAPDFPPMHVTTEEKAFKAGATAVGEPFAKALKYAVYALEQASKDENFQTVTPSAAIEDIRSILEAAK